MTKASFVRKRNSKFFKTAPRTAIDAVSGVILSERDLNAKHGYVAIDKQIDDARHEYQIKGPESFQLFSDILHILVLPMI